MLDEVSQILSASNFQAITVALGIVLAFTLVGRLLLIFFKTTVRRVTRRTESRADDIVLAAIKGPVAWAITLFGVAIAQAETQLLPNSWDAEFKGFLFIAYTVLAYVALFRLINNLLHWYITDRARQTATTLDDQLLPFMRRVLLIILTLGTLVLVLQYFQIPVGTFVATLGVGSLALALAAQAALGDAISGFLILLDRPYRIGDRIELPDSDITGDVVDIGLRTTRILTLDYRMVVVPNHMIANNIIMNHAYPDANLRVDLPVGIAYGSDIRQAKAVLLSAIRRVEGVHRERQPDVIVTAFGPSSIDLEMRCWINAYADKPRMIDRINEAAYNALNAAGIEIPFPQRTVWHRVEPSAVSSLRAALNGEEQQSDPEAEQPETSPPTLNAPT
ncbi:MAG TPA: mechanosensitive ion channel family protein [Ardenticatenaceae bacterium]|jgi:small-conductance mechanosensitive channel